MVHPRDTSGSPVSVGGVVDGAPAQLNRLVDREVVGVARVQHAVGEGGA